MFSIKLNLNNKVQCECCGKNRPIREWKPSYAPLEGGNSLYNLYDDDKDTYKDVLCFCPNCGYTYLAENEKDIGLREFVFSDEFQKAFSDLKANKNVPEWAVTWILYARLCVVSGRISQAVCAWMKFFDYGLATNSFETPQALSNIVEIYNATQENDIELSGGDRFFIYCVLMDAIRRFGDFEQAKNGMQALYKARETCDPVAQRAIDTLGHLIDTQDRVTHFKFNVEEN